MLKSRTLKMKNIVSQAQISVIMLIFAAMVFLNYTDTKRKERDLLKHDAAAILNDMRAYTETSLHEPHVVLGAVAENIRFMILQGASFDMISKYIKDLTGRLSGNEMFTSYTLDVFGLFEASGGEKYISATGWTPPAGFSYSVRPWYKAAVEANGLVGVTDPHLHVLHDVLTVTYSRRIFDDKGEHIGIIGFCLKFDKIRNYLNGISSKYGKSAVLLDNQQRVIYHPDSMLWGKRLAELPYNIASLTYAPGLSGGILEHKIKCPHNENFVVFFSQLDNGWHLGVAVPVKEHSDNIMRQSVIFSAIAIFSALLLIALILKISRARHLAEERVRLMFDSMPLVANFWNKDLKNTQTNDVALKLFDLSSTQEYLDKFYQLSPQYQPDGQLSSVKASELVNKAFKEGYCRFEWMHQNLKGEQIPTEIVLVRGEYNNDLVVLGYTQDLRQLKNAVAQAHESKQANDMLKSMLNGLDLMIYVTDPNTSEILFMNNYMSKEYNIKEDCTGQLCYKILQEGISEKCDFCPCRKLDDDPDSVVVWEERSTLTNRVYRNSDRYIKWHDGRTAHIQYSIDLTELISAKEQAEQGNRFKSLFLSRMSHEIRTPINAILGTTEIQLMDESLTPSLRDALLLINNSGDLLLTIINDLLDLSKIESNKMELSSVRYEVSSLINDTVQLNIMQQSSKPLEFELHVDENTPLRLIGDEIRIKQILNNLLSNAFKYTDEGSVKLSIYVENEDNEDEAILVFQISDTGRGMTAEQLNRLGDEYARFSQETNYAAQGTGLGMSITKNLIKIMQGKLMVESEPGKGSTFTVRLPQKRVCSDRLGKELAQNLMKYRTDNTVNDKRAQFMRDYMPYGRVLVVDDVESNLYVASGLMSPYGLSVDTADSGLEAIELIKSGKAYDIIFMDHMMPKMDGIEATKRIRGMGYTHSIVALTANAVAGQAEVFLSNGFDDFISKPIDLRVLNNVLNKLIRDKQPPEVVKEARRKQSEIKAHKQEAMVNVNSNLIAIFLRDLQKTIPVLENTIKNIDTISSEEMLLYTISIHALKSALANVDEKALSKVAAKLEAAGKNGDKKVISTQIPSFLHDLSALIQKFTPSEEQGSDANTDEDPTLLRDQLFAFNIACVDYDKKGAKNALAQLTPKQWSRQTKEMLNALSELLLHGDFEEAMFKAQEFMKNNSELKT
ncbi:MAG: response regulator [Chitinispirillales bacterium]|jgi:signal transduction histidine kinase/CheY-like chemotaxis protein/HPt (histidine-containing phosphotransfer) domain-containing protein|nr:response regulator [Chitinispirillales bacterium]